MTITSRRYSILVSLVLILLIATLMISGCMDERQGTDDRAAAPGEIARENTVASPGTTTTATVVHDTATPGPDASAPYITFDPIGEKKIGDLLVFSGTTNLPEKTPVYLYWTIGTGGGEKLVSNREVYTGPDGSGRWRFVSDSSGLDPGTYSVTVTTGKKDVKGSAQFTLSGTSLRPKSIIYYSGAKKSSAGTPAITVNPIADHKQGDVFLVTGTSSLEEGTLLLCSIYPVYFEDTSKRPATTYKGPSGSATDTIVVRGTEGINRWSFALDTNAFEKTDYVVNVSTVNEDHTIPEIFGRAQFTLS